MLEHDIQNAIRVHVSTERLATLFRGNVGNAWTGNKIERRSSGSVLIYDARPFTTGLPQGFPDLFGIRSIEVTPNMVGEKLAVFAFIEVKQPGKQPTKTQQRMIEYLRTQGAIGGVAHSVEEAATILRGDSYVEPKTKTRI